MFERGKSQGTIYTHLTVTLNLEETSLSPGVFVWREFSYLEAERCKVPFASFSSVKCKISQPRRIALSSTARVQIVTEKLKRIKRIKRISRIVKVLELEIDSIYKFI